MSVGLGVPAPAAHAPDMAGSPGACRPVLPSTGSLQLEIGIEKNLGYFPSPGQIGNQGEREWGPGFPPGPGFKFRPTSQLPSECPLRPTLPRRFADSPTDHESHWLREVSPKAAIAIPSGRMSMFMRLSSCVPQARALLAFGIKGSTLLMPHPGQAPTEVAPTLVSGFGMAATSRPLAQFLSRFKASDSSSTLSEHPG